MTARYWTGLFAVLFVLLAGCSSDAFTSALARPASTPSPAFVAPTTIETTTTAASSAATPAAVDAVVASDGTPLDLAANTLSDYPDAYAMIEDDCNTMATLDDGDTPAEWLAAHLVNAAIPGEEQALKVGIPLVCPQFNVDLLQVVGN